MRPADDPRFFKLPPPEGRSRESSIRLDRNGKFSHDGQLVEHGKLARAMATWISRHPDDGRYILTNGYDWTYFDVEDVPFFVHSVEKRDGRFWLTLTDGSEEALRPEETRLGEDGALETRVKHGADGGPYAAKFERAALVDLSEFLEEDETGQLRLGAGGPVLG